MSLYPDAQRSTAPQWVYASLSVIDGQRRITPAQVGPDMIDFDAPPRLQSGTVQIILRNGSSEQRHTAHVLAHAPDATRIPIELIAGCVVSEE